MDATEHSAAAPEPPSSAAPPVEGPTPPSPEATPQTPVRRRHRLPHLRRPRVPTKVHTLEAFRSRDYRLVWAGIFWSNSAFWLHQIVIGWLIYDLTRSPILTSLTLGMDAIAMLLLGPLGGFLVDVFDRRKLLIGVMTYHALLVLAFGVGIILDRVGAPHIFAYALLTGLSLAVGEPARVSIMANVVPREGLMNAFALHNLNFGVTRVFVPALGGLLIAVLGPGPTLMISSALMFVAVGLTLMVRPEDHARVRPKLTSAFKGLLEGARYVRGEPNIVVLLVFGTIPALLILPYGTALLPVYAAEVFSVGPSGLGLLMSSTGVGMVLGTVVVASLGEIRFKGKLLVLCALLGAITLVLLSQNPWLGASFVILGVLSASTVTVFTTTEAGVHSVVPDEMRGRVSGLAMLTWGTFPLGGLIAGGLAQGLGVQPATLIGAGILVAALALLVLRFRFIWRLE